MNSTKSEAAIRQNRPKTDLTAHLLARQLRALGAKRFEFGIKSEFTQRMDRRSWDVWESIRRVPWLKYRNANRHHIYVRPETTEPVILIDDLSVPALLRMEADDVRCACIVETSPFNFQAWVRLETTDLAPELATAVGELLASRYDGDSGSKDFRHLGRAVGFTNVKPKHVQKSGYFPFTKLVECGGHTTPSSSELLADANNVLEEHTAEREMRRQKLIARRTNTPSGNPSDIFDRAVTNIHARYGAKTDGSRADAAAARHMVHRGFSRDDIELAMLENNDIHTRREGHVEDYVERTIRWAFAVTE